MNQLLLSHSGEYATAKQWRMLGGTIRTDTKAEKVVFWKMKDHKFKDENGKEIVKQIPVLKYYQVFHISQVDGVEPLNIEPKFTTEPIETADRILNSYIKRENITLNIKKSDRAYYKPKDDSINLPLISQFAKAEAYYATAFHEAVHSTMTEARCNRMTENKNAFFGNEVYTKEELVAEIGSSIMMNFLGIETKQTFKNSVAYIQHWIKVLEKDTRMIVSASVRAEKAFRFILGNQGE